MVLFCRLWWGSTCCLCMPVGHACTAAAAGGVRIILSMRWLRFTAECWPACFQRPVCTQRLPNTLLSCVICLTVAHAVGGCWAHQHKVCPGGRGFALASLHAGPAVVLAACCGNMFAGFCWLGPVWFTSWLDVGGLSTPMQGSCLQTVLCADMCVQGMCIQHQI